MSILVETMYYTLHYQLCADYLTKRVAFRAHHIEFITPYYRRGELLLGGAYEDTRDGALLIFDVEDPELIENFARLDPYVKNGIVIAWELRKWNVAIGNRKST